MNRRNLTLALIMLLIVVMGCTPTPEPSSDIACDPYGCISLSQFSEKIALALIGKVEGYIVHVGGVSPVAWGQARTDVDQPSMAMSPGIPINVMSISKVLTTIGVLQSLSKHGLTVDTPISPYLWPIWVRGPNIDTITFRDLLTHHSGFRDDCEHGIPSYTTYADLEQQIANGVQLSDKKNAVYNNCNFAIFREMLPFMEGDTNPGTISLLNAQWSANFYASYMNQHVFAPLGMSNRQCAPAEPNVILSYPFPAGTTHGDDWKDWTLECGGGGWVLSANDLYAVANDLANGNVLLNTEQKTLMDSGCLGWDCSVGTQTDFRGKNGGANIGNTYLSTFLGVFKCNVPVVVIVNSALPGNSNITNVVDNAFEASKTDGAPSECPNFRRPQAQVLPTAFAPTRTPFPLLPQPRSPNEPLPTATHTPTPAPRGSQPPRPPVLVTPIDGAVIECGRVNLSWHSAVDPSGIRDYDVELEKLVDRNFVTEKTWNNVRGGSTFFDAICGTRYRWRVRATDNAGNLGTWSRYGYFREQESITSLPTLTPTPAHRDTQAPQPPVQITPINGITVNCGQVTLTWKPTTDPSGIRDYDVELEKLVDSTYMAEKVGNNVRGDSVSFDPACDTRYRWRVRATDNAGNQGNWTEFQDFQVQSMIQ